MKILFYVSKDLILTRLTKFSNKDYFIEILKLIWLSIHWKHEINNYSNLREDETGVAIIEGVFTVIDGVDRWKLLLSDETFETSETVDICSSWTAVGTGEWDVDLLDKRFVFNWSKVGNVVAVDEDFNMICWKWNNVKNKHIS